MWRGRGTVDARRLLRVVRARGAHGAVVSDEAGGRAAVADGEEGLSEDLSLGRSPRPARVGL